MKKVYASLEGIHLEEVCLKEKLTSGVVEEGMDLPLRQYSQMLRTAGAYVSLLRSMSLWRCIGK